MIRPAGETIAPFRREGRAVPRAPIALGATVPRFAWLAAIRTAVLALTPKRRAAPRRDPPPATCAAMRCRRSREYALAMIHLQSG